MPINWKGVEGMGAWWAGKGPEWEQTQLARKEMEDARRAAEAEAARERAAQLVSRSFQAYQSYGADGVAGVLADAEGEWRGTPLESAVMEYADLLNAGKESGDFSKLEMELRDDFVKFGGELPEKPKFSPRTVNLPGGGTKQTDSAGNIYLTDPTGREITDPQERAQMLEAARVIEQEQAMEVARARAGGTQAGSGVGGRANEVIDRGVEAARAMPVLKRTLQLLGEVKTGGFEGVARRLEGVTGVQSASEAELSNLLARNVLSQLKATFGSQFTQAEGDRLASIDAGIGKSTEGNTRIITQLLRMNQQKIAAAMKAAKGMGDAGALAEIEQYVNYNLTDDSEAFRGYGAPQPAAQPPSFKFLGFEGQ